MQRDGYYDGPIDGVLGPMTREAIAAFQADNGLESCDGLSGHRHKDTIDRSVVITVALQLFLNIDNYPIGRQSIVAIDWAVVRIISVRGITPCREPVARIPVIPAAVHKNDPIVMASPPIAIMPLPVVIAEGCILSTAERVTAEDIVNRNIASTIIGEVSCAVDREVSIPIDGYAVARAKLIGIASTISVEVSRPVDRQVSIPIDGYAVASAKLIGIPRTVNIDVFCPIDRHVSIAIHAYVVARTKLLRFSVTIDVDVSSPIRCDVSPGITGNVASAAKLFLPREVLLAIRAA